MNMKRPNLRRTLFWDIDADKIDYQKHARFVIGRVLTRGNLDEWLELRDFYGLDRIRDEALQIRYLDKVTLSFCAVVFKTPREKFRCWSAEPSIRKLWSF